MPVSKDDVSDRHTTVHIPFKFDIEGRAWIERSAIPTILQDKLTHEDLELFCSQVDASLNGDGVKPKMEKTEEEKKKDFYSELFSCILLVFICFMGACSLDCLDCGGNNVKRKLNQPKDLRNCIKVLRRENKKQSGIAFELDLNGSVDGGGYVNHIKCRIDN